MRSISRALASEELAQQAAVAQLERGGSATHAVAAGFFAAAGAGPAPLFGPVALLVAGLGMGARAFDGRVRQPGLGARRPRGFESGASIPPAARAAAPHAVRAVAVALAYAGGHGFSDVVGAGVKVAKDTGASRRAALLARIASVGSAALSEGELARALLSVAGTGAGGLLSGRDLALAPELDVAADIDDSGVARVPWLAGGEPGGHGQGELRATHTILAADARGVLAALCYRTDRGLPVDAWQTELCLLAQPVMRGRPRPVPGSAVTSPAPLGIRFANGLPVQVLADDGADAPASIELALRRLGSVVR